MRRAQRGAERDELLAELEGLEAWYRDLVVVARRRRGAVVHADRLDDLREDVAAGAADGAVEAAETVRETWRALEEFNLNPSLALEALFVRLRRALAGAASGCPRLTAATLIRLRRRSSAGRALHS